MGGNSVDKYQITGEQVEIFKVALCREERAPGTVEKYMRDLAAFRAWTGDMIEENSASRWKERLLEGNYAPSTINSMLAAVHKFYKYCGLEAWRTKPLRIQRQIFRDERRELTRAEFARLLSQAEKRSRRLALLMETICATGIRVSEVQYITLEAAMAGKTAISLKGKIRTILLPKKLCKKLIKFAKEKKIAAGELFLTASGKGLSRRQIWSEMKRLCKDAGVEESKVFPHNLRHLFAVVFYQAYHDIACLADVLGHSNIDTTRCYLITSGIEHARRLDQLGLVI